MRTFPPPYFWRKILGNKSTWIQFIFIYFSKSNISHFYSYLGLFWFVRGGVFMQLRRTEGLENEFPPRHNGGSVGLCCFRKGASSPWCLLCPRHLCNADLEEAVVYRSPCCDYFPNLPKMTIELSHLSECSFLRTMKMWKRGILVTHFNCCFSYEFLDHSCFCSSLFY